MLRLLKDPKRSIITAIDSCTAAACDLVSCCSRREEEKEKHFRRRRREQRDHRGGGGGHGQLQLGRQHLFLRLNKAQIRNYSDSEFHSSKEREKILLIILDRVSHSRFHDYICKRTLTSDSDHGLFLVVQLCRVPVHVVHKTTS